MARALRTAALAIGAVALVATGVGAPAVAGIATSTLTLASGGLSVAASLLQKRPATSSAGSQIEFLADPRSGVPYPVGRTGTSGRIVFRRASDGWSANTPNDLHDLVVILSGAGPIDGIESFSADKKPVSFDAAGNAIGEYRDKMFQRTQLGSVSDIALAVAAGASPRPSAWTDAHRLPGMAAAMWRLRYDSKQRFFQNGVPKPVWVLRGARCYDPRKDSTYPGGSGPHRWNDESTWEWTECPYLNGLTWCIGRHQNGKRVMGLGARIDQIIVSQFVEAANICDVNGWKVGGVVYTRPDSKWTNLKWMLQAGGGEPLRVNALIGCRINAPRVSLATITEDDIVGDAELATAQPPRSRLNAIIPSYRSEAHGWETIPGAAVSVPGYVAADGDERTREVEYKLVQSAAQAAVLARYDIEDSREAGPGSFPLKPHWIALKAGDCVTLQLRDKAPVKLLLMRRRIEPTTTVVTFDVRSETDAKHAAALGQQAIEVPPPPSANEPTFPSPTLEEWELQAGTASSEAGDADAPAVSFVGAVTRGEVDDVIFSIRVDESGSQLQSVGTEPASVMLKEVTGLRAATAYRGYVQYRSRGVLSDPLELGPVTTAAMPVAQRGAYQVRSLDPAYPAQSTANAITISLATAVIDDGRFIQMAARTIGGLDAATSYGVFFNLATQRHEVEAYPAATRMSSSNFIFVLWQSTLNGDGTAPEGDTPPPGYGGGGANPNVVAQ